MKTPITLDRARIWMAVATIAVIALGSFWLQNVIMRGDDDYQHNTARQEPDYYVEKFNFIKLSNNGKANYHVTGDSLVHLPRTDQYEIQHPLINSFDDQRTPITISAGRAVVEQKSDTTKPRREQDVVHLYDQVSVERPEGLNSRFMRLDTEYLMLMPDSDIIKTDKAVSLMTANTDTTAIGLNANNAKQEFELMSKVRVHIRKNAGHHSNSHDH
ncbi:LPS export ABC transporter periplasmic protein LptC [Undibacterium oligocarboniphilum]|uniref:LPS export ABC transporter periplasmic protein LptC n=1 Tax=Undibacterium oligocarboniphilum TaxID=666702 RepID=A0A850QI28_9BURK|nr:LPS export ABC transporter periplasmic protein LptC [Undibacterium oligocarboniphilum]MBC3870482.1 LPS export ABC transporter periplasmic protein LptC [Undibacterium oligocarboniphilum]NVO78717.1 LPS export ABC transporter periplasmic protein LptC [Undibacterium oligocarboniphilum]